MCNTVKGNDKYCCLQRYMFDKHLDQEKISQEKIIKILTQGIKSSGNQAEGTLREISSILPKKNVEVDDVINNYVYIIDCPAREEPTRIALQETASQQRWFQAKRSIMLKQSPPGALSEDKESVNFFGRRQHPEKYLISMSVSELNSKFRGKHMSSLSIYLALIKLTRRRCVKKQLLNYMILLVKLPQLHQ